MLIMIIIASVIYSGTGGKGDEPDSSPGFAKMDGAGIPGDSSTRIESPLRQKSPSVHKKKEGR